MKTIKPEELYVVEKDLEISGLVAASDLTGEERKELKAENNELLELYGEIFTNRYGEVDCIITSVRNGKRGLGIELDEGSIEYIKEKVEKTLSVDESWQDDYYYDRE